ncbi:MAG: hypothetical protein ACXQTP_03815 [Candidatus Methanofastidiosia archaeon]
MMDPIELLTRIVQVIFELARSIAEEISHASEGIIPPDAVGVFSVVILLLLIRIGFDFTKKVVDILLIVFGVYLLLAIIPNII